MVSVMQRGASQASKRILVIEDSPVVGPFTADLLSELGYDVVGPAPTMPMARELIDGAFEAALMDVHIRGERVFPLCDALDDAACRSSSPAAMPTGTCPTNGRTGRGCS